MEEKGITLGTILSHMQAMEIRINAKFKMVDQRFAMVDKRFDAVDRRFNRLEYQIEAIDKRLDSVEIEHLPARVTRLEKHAKLAA